VSDDVGHLQCPFCTGYDVSRMYLASARLDACECRSCGARWDEEPDSGTYRGLSSRTSTLTPRER
jgi:hypothetical protein